MTKMERTKQKLNVLRGFYKKFPGHYKFTPEEAMAEVVDIITYILFLIEEAGINFHNRNDIYNKD